MGEPRTSIRVMRILLPIYYTFPCFHQLSSILMILMKIYITNYCNFYHEKLGVWLDTSDAPKFSEMTDQDIILSREFEEKYKDSIPQSIIELSNNLIEQSGVNQSRN